MNIDQRIAEIERVAASVMPFPASIPGTTITRVMKMRESGTVRPDGPGYEWSIAIGGMGMPKAFYTGDSIEQIVETIEDELGIRQPEITKGDVVMVPCLVTGTSTLCGRFGGSEPVVDLRPIESTSGEPFGEHIIKPFTVYAVDVKRD